MSPTLPRYQRHTEAAQDRARLDRILADTIPVTPAPTATAGGDTRRLRGIPAIGRGVHGHIPGTRPDIR